MANWVHVGLIILGAAFITYSSLQEHEVRIKALEVAMDKHLSVHDLQYKQIMDITTKTQLDVAEIKAQIQMMGKK